MMEIKLVKQEESFGCVIACMAMVLGCSYDEVRKDFVNDFNRKGINADKAIGYLADKGFQTIHKKVGWYNNVDFSRKEMLKPFAPAHLLRIRAAFDNTMTHLIVMTGKGKLICPQETPEKEIRQCYEISDVWGIY